MNLYKIIKQAYNFGRDNGTGRSDKNLNDFLEKEEVKQLLIFLRENNQTVPSETIQFMKDASIEKLNHNG